MAIFPGSAIPTSGAAEYSIDQSLRFENGDTAYLTRTPSSAGNRKTFTLSYWTKLSNALPSCCSIMFFPQNGTTFSYVATESQAFRWDEKVSGVREFNLQTTAVFRDPAAWYHVVWKIDTTQATASDRVKLYVNGSQITDFASETYPSQNFDFSFNNTIEHSIGGNSGSGSYFDGYMAEVHFIDGQALTPDSFGEVDETYGHWKPIEYTGTYGTNGFYLPFSGTFYNDASGNGNNWTANNLATTDVVLDSPTNNFCVMNPLAKGQNGATTYPSNTFYEGNLKLTSPSNDAISYGTFGWSGKGYFEYYFDMSNIYHYVGVSEDQQGDVFKSCYYYSSSDGETYLRYVKQTDLLGVPSTGGVLGVAFDTDAGTVKFYLNGSLLDTVSFTPENGIVYPWKYTPQSSNTGIFNFGQDSSFAGNKTAQNNTDDNGYGDFYYPVPSGFLSLCSANLSEPAVVPGENFNAVTYTGAGTPTVVTGVGFQPDLGWFANRAGDNHPVYDALRGTNRIYTNLTAAESSGSFSSWDSDGFTVNADGEIGDSGGSYVAWLWKANNTSGSSNTDGSITSTVAANVDAGFSIVGYTGNGSAGSTVGHGLSQVPDVVILKNRSSAGYWSVFGPLLSGAGTNDEILHLNTTDAQYNPGSDYWNGDTPISSSVITFGAYDGVNGSGENYIAYCFHSVDGYSKFGSYTGNGSSDGPFVYTGFRPAFIMVKKTDGAGVDGWTITDTDRDPINVADQRIQANSSSAEAGDVDLVDHLSNGFKIRYSGQMNNQSGTTYIYMAFAEYPFKYTTAR